MNAKGRGRRPPADGGESKPGRFRPNPLRQALYALVVLAAILGGYLAVTVVESWRSGEQSSGVAVSVPIAQRKPWYKERGPVPAMVRAPDLAIFPETAGDRDGATARPYEESLPTEVYVPPPTGSSRTTSPAPVGPAGSPRQEAGNATLPADGGLKAGSAGEKAPATVVAEPPAKDAGMAGPATQTPGQVAAVVADRPMIAIVIDDMGVDRRRSKRIIDLDGPLTVSFLTYAEDLARQTVVAREAGHELLLHLPMEPGDHRVDPGPNVLLRDIEPDELRRRLKWGLDRFDGYVGVNNHMGSKFTADRPSMAILMRELKRRDVFFLDSRTTSRTVGPSLARHYEVPVLERNIFLDNDNDSTAIRARLAETERLARRQGIAIAIGHPRDGTLEALSEWLPTVGARGFLLVPLTTILARARAAG